MAGSLRNTTEQQQPQYTEAVIRQTCASDIGQKFVFVIVEDIEDKLTYEKFLSAEDVHVMISQDEEGNRGYQNVEDIVSHIRQDDVTLRICGIRDTDYTRYEDAPHVFPEAVFTTDQRDLEMTLLASNSVQDGLANWKSDITNLLPQVYEDSRQIGYMRAANHVCNLGCNFKRKVKLSKVWDDSTHQLKKNWLDELTDSFIQNSANTQSPHYPYTKEKLNAFIGQKHLGLESVYNICQGHDVVWLLYSSLPQNNFDVKEITDKMIESYSEWDFKETHLFAAMLNWAKRMNVNLC